MKAFLPVTSLNTRWDFFTASVEVFFVYASGVRPVLSGRDDNGLLLSVNTYDHRQWCRIMAPAWVSEVIALIAPIAIANNSHSYRLENKGKNFFAQIKK